MSEGPLLAMTADVVQLCVKTLPTIDHLLTAASWDVYLFTSINMYYLSCTGSFAQLGMSGCLVDSRTKVDLLLGQTFVLGVNQMHVVVHSTQLLMKTPHAFGFPQEQYFD